MRAKRGAFCVSRVCVVIISLTQGDYLQRIMYDSVFFIWVGLVLANIITGLMVDTFSAIREEEAERKEVLLQLHVSIFFGDVSVKKTFFCCITIVVQVIETQCFVCGITRAVYDDLSLGKKYVGDSSILSSTFEMPERGFKVSIL